MNELQRSGWIFLVVSIAAFLLGKEFNAWFFLFFSIQHFFAHYCIEAYFEKKEQSND